MTTESPDTLRKTLFGLGLRHTSRNLDDIVALATKKRWGLIKLLEHIGELEVGGTHGRPQQVQQHHPRQRALLAVGVLVALTLLAARGHREPGDDRAARVLTATAEVRDVDRVIPQRQQRNTALTPC